MTVTEDNIRHVAKLARLQLNDDAVKLYARQVTDILGYVDILSRLDTKRADTSSNMISSNSSHNNAFRDDEIRQSLGVERALGNAPSSEQGSFIVPRVVR